MKKSLTLIILFIFTASLCYASANMANWHWKKGKKAYDKGDYAAAISHFLKGTKSNPQDGNIFRWLGCAYFRNHRYQDAIDALNQSQKVPHNNEAEDDTWWYLAKSYDQLDQLDSALSAMRKYIEKKPDNSNGFSWLSYYCSKMNQYDEAIMAAQRAIELKPDSADAYESLGFAYLGKKQYKESFAAVKKAIELNPNGIFSRNLLGHLYYDKGDYLEAAEAYRKAVELEPNDTELLWGMANSYRHAGRYDEAIAAISKRIELESNSGNIKEKADSFGLRSIVYRHKGNFESALQDAEKAFSLNPTSDFSRVSRGTAYLDQGNYTEAEKLLSQVKNNTGARVLEATAYAKQGKTEEAEEICASIQGRGAGNKSVTFQEDLKALLLLMKPHSRERRIKARSFETKGMHREALREYSDALKAADELDAQMIRDSLFRIARMYPAVAGLPEEARRSVLRGEMLVKEGSFEKAAAEYRQAIRIAPYAAKLYFNAALVFAELKDYAEAIRNMNIYLQAAPEAPDARAAKDEIIKWEFMMEKDKY